MRVWVSRSPEPVSRMPFDSQSQIAVAYQFQYTERELGTWAPQHAILFRYWFGKRLSARGRN